jgi:hypothetical protein
MRTISPYIEPPTIPEGMTCVEYRINRPTLKRSMIRRLLRSSRR